MAEVKQVSTGSKLESIGTVKTVVGEVKAVDAAGNERILQAGDKVFANETIVTAAGGLVMIEFADGSHLDLPSAAQIVLDTDVFNPANAAASEGKELTAEQIQEMIARGEDPTAVTEATAAGIGSGDEGGSSFIVVDFNNTQGAVTSGFNTLGIPGPESTTFTELPPVEDEAVPAPVPVVSVAVEVEVEVDGEGGTPPPEEVLATTPGVVVDGVSIVEGTEDQGRVVNFVIKLDQAYTQDVTVSYQINNGVAEAGSDFTGVLVGTVTIPAGQTSFIVPVTIVQDGDIESNENFSIVLTGATNATINPAASSATVTIIDDDVNADNDVDSVSESQLESSGGVFHGGIQGEGQETANVLNNDDLSNAFAADGTTPLFGPLQVFASTVDVFSGEALIGQVSFAADGSYTLTLNETGMGLVSALAPEETLDISADYTMGNTVGSLDSATLTITITGTNDVPEITVDTGNPRGGNDTVFESGLAGGSDAAADSEFATGTFTVSDPDGLDDIESVTINGVTVAIGDLVGSAFNGASGTLTITGYNNGVASYTYELTSITTDVAEAAETDVFTLTTSDGIATSSPATITIEIVDDVPTANDDSATAAEDASVTVDVFANDVAGADGVDLVTGVVLGDAPTKGNVVYNSDGTFTYTPNAGAEGTDTFTYVITDADGDPSEATVTITLAPDSVPEISIGEHSAVDEGALPGGYLGGDLTSDGSFNITTGGDTVQKLEVQDKDGNWVDVTSGGTVEGPNGTLVVTNTNGDYTWVYTLASVTTDGAGVETNDFAVRVTDSDDDTANTTLSIVINDDVPNAVDDTATQSPENAPVVYNVVTNTDGTSDAKGADGATLTAATVGQGAGSVSFDANGQVTYTPAAGEEGTVIINYTITDADGDPSDATLTITLAADSVPEISIGEHSAVDEGALPGGNLGGDLTSDGTFNISTGGDTVKTLEVQDKDGNWVDVTDGGTVEGANGTLVVTNTNGSYTWVYTLTSPTTDGAGAETNDFAVRVTDSDNDTANTTLSIVINDDVPVAVNENGGTVTEDVAGSLGGNVLSNDASGADAPASFVGWGADTAAINALNTYGTLTQNANGSWSYALDNTRAATQALGAGFNQTYTLNYTMQDADGDTSPAQLTITVKGAADSASVTTASASGADATVYEHGLTSVGDTTETTSGSFTVSATDGIANIVVGGTTVTAAELAALSTTNKVISTGEGTLTLTGYNSGTGAVSYTYTLNATIDNDSKVPTGSDAVSATDFTDNVTVTVNGIGGTTASDTLSIRVVDDTPTATNENGGTVTEDVAGSLGGNVLSNDASGADAPASFVGWGADTAAINALNTYGTLTQNANGSWSYALDNTRAATQALGAGFNQTYTLNYTMQDADGDTSPAQLTITVKGAADSASVVTAAATGPDNTVYEAGLNPNGSNAASNTETSAGSFTISTTDGILNMVIGGTTYTLAQMQAFNGTQTVNTGEGVLTLTGYSGTAAGGTVSYSYTLSATIDNDSKAGATGTSFDDSVTLTVNGVGGSTASDDLVVRIVDDVPTFTYINNGIIGNQVATLTGTHDITFGADGEGSINLSALTTLSGVTYSSAVHNLDGSTTITAGTNNATTGFFSLTISANGTYSFNLLDPRPDVIKVADFGSVQGGQAVTSLTLGTGANAITFTGLGGDQIKPTSAGFGVNDGNLNAGDDFSVTFGGNKVDNVTFSIKQQSSTAFGMTWTTDTGETGTVSFSADGNLVINPLSDFSTITFNTTSGSAKVDSFSYSQNLLPDNQVLQFSVSGTDGDGDISASQTLSLQLLGGVIGAPINGTAGSESILGTSSGETIDGKAGNDIISGGLGDDILIGGTGSDTFVWKSGESGADKVTDFTKGVGGDVLNLADILQGEHSTAASLGSYLSFSYNAGTNITTITIDSNGVTAGGTGQSIQVNGDLTYGSSDPTVIINKLLADGNLKTDA